MGGEGGDSMSPGPRRKRALNVFLFQSGNPAASKFSIAT